LRIPTLDVHPARLTTPDGEMPSVRVYASQGTVLVFASINGQVDVVNRASYSGIETAPRRLKVVTLEDGTEWTVERTGGCSCNSPFKSVNPRRFL